MSIEVCLPCVWLLRVHWKMGEGLCYCFFETEKCETFRFEILIDFIFPTIFLATKLSLRLSNDSANVAW